MEEKSSYTFEVDDTSITTTPTASFASANRFITFNSSRCCKYYLVEIFASILGPFSGLVAVPAWGIKGAQNMMYVPKDKSGYVFLLLTILFAAMSIIPFLELFFILSGVRSDSNFSVGAEGFLLVLCLFLAPCGSAIKYGFMSQRRFEEKVLTTGHSMTAFSSIDSTADSMTAWASTLKDDLLDRELALAMWRSGEDGNMQFSVVVDRGSNSREVGDGGDGDGGDGDGVDCNDGDGSSATTLKQVPLVSVLRAVIDRHRRPRLSRPMRLRTASIIFPFAPFALIPSFWRVFALGKPFFGSDNFEIAACVLAFLSNLQYVHWFFWAMFHTTGHLNRAQDIANEYNKLLVPPLDESEKKNKTVVGGSDRSSGSGSNSAAVVVLATTAHNVKVWERGRRALLLFGRVYWLRMSWITATTAAASSLLLTIVVVQLILSLLRGSPMQITSFVLMVCMLILFNSSAFSFVVIAGMKTMRKRREHRTNVLRRSMMMKGKNSEVSAELRHLAWLLASELESHKIRMLGLPLNSRMLESLFGGFVAIGVVFYQIVNSAGSGVSVK